jgi:hypothetical protein
MRHSSIDLTMNVYTDPRLLDVHGALESLPELRLDASRSVPARELPATGTDPREGARQFAHIHSFTSRKSRALVDSTEPE